MKCYQNGHKTTALNKRCCYNTSYNGMLEPLGGKLSDSEMGATVYLRTKGKFNLKYHCC